MSIPSPSFSIRITRERLALAALVCLLLVATALRFYDLTGNSVWYDEAVAAANSGGALAEVLPKTRCCNSSPILYPLALWAVQKVDASAFSIRILPAIASVLTVGVMLFLLPRFGVSRWAAFLAALLATLSVAAIKHAQDAREYSIDALLATLLIAGLLWYLRDGRKGLLCVALFVAPLLQYGLALFGIAVIGAALILPARTLAGTESESDSYRSRIRNWFGQHIALVWPAVCFLAGCAISGAATVLHQWRAGGWDGYDRFYYQGGFDAADILVFAVSRIWLLLNYHLPPAIAIAAVAAFALMLLVSLAQRQRLNAIATLALIAVGAAIIAALLTFYPLGEVRPSLYLGPVIFLAAGVAIHWTADRVAALLRRAWLVPALGVAAAGAIGLTGVSDIRQDSPYNTRENIRDVISFLEERVAEDDIVFAASYAAPSMQFYQDEKPSNYHYGKLYCRPIDQCNREMVNLVGSIPNVPNRIFLVQLPQRKLIRTATPGAAGIVDGSEAEWMRGDVTITAYLVNDEPHRADDKPASRWRWQRADARPGAANTPDDATWTDITGAHAPHYFPGQKDTGKFLRAYVSYEKNGTVRQVQTEAISPIEGLEILGKQVSVKQIYGGGRHNVFLIENGSAIKESVAATARSDYETFVSGEPAVSSTFDVYLSENTLAYVKKPCVLADTEARFFLHVIPTDPNTLPGNRKRYAYDNLDFVFSGHGTIVSGKCLASIPLPEYDIAAIRTGQFVLGQGHLWEVEFPFAAGN